MESKPTDGLSALAASFPLLVYDHGEQTVLSVADSSSRTIQAAGHRADGGRRLSAGLGTPSLSRMAPVLQ